MNTLFEWEADLYHHTPKNGGWYTNVIVITLLLVGIAFYMGNILFGIFILLAGVALIALGKTHPGRAHFKIDERGVIIDRTLHPFNFLESFWLENDTLFIKTNNNLSPHLALPLNDVDEEELETLLLEYLPKEEYRKTLIDSIAEYINF